MRVIQQLGRSLAATRSASERSLLAVVDVLPLPVVGIPALPDRRAVLAARLPLVDQSWLVLSRLTNIRMALVEFVCCSGRVLQRCRLAPLKDGVLPLLLLPCLLHSFQLLLLIQLLPQLRGHRGTGCFHDWLLSLRQRLLARALGCLVIGEVVGSLLSFLSQVLGLSR